MKLRDIYKYADLLEDVIHVWQDADDTLETMEVGQEGRLNAENPIKTKAKGGRFRIYLVAERYE